MLNKTFITTALFFIYASTVFNADALADDHDGLSRIEQGRELAFKRIKGNCLACHYIEGGELMGNYGPPLLAMKARYPDREVLRAQIWDAAVKNPDTRMPPFGRNHILSEEEIDLVTDFIHTL